MAAKRKSEKKAVEQTGRPPHEPTAEQREQVEAMSAYGVPQEEIARVIGVDPKTLRLHYREELDTAAAKANSKVAQFLFRRATDEGGGAGAVTAAIFWLKTRAGWKETSRHEHTGADGKPIEVDLTSLTDKELEQLERLIAKAALLGAGEGGAAPQED